MILFYLLNFKYFRLHWRHVEVPGPGTALSILNRFKFSCTTSEISNLLLYIQNSVLIA